MFDSLELINAYSIFVSITSNNQCSYSADNTLNSISNHLKVVKANRETDFAFMYKLVSRK